MFPEGKFFRSYWIHFVAACLPFMVHGLKECTKKDVCRCSTDEGVIDLWSLAGAGRNVPRFKDIVDNVKESPFGHVSWNPCNKWTANPSVTPQSDQCKDIAVCYTVGEGENIGLLDIGNQDTADYSYNEPSGNCVLTFKGMALPKGGPESSSTHIYLQCDPHEEGRLESLGRTTPTGDEFKVFLKLHSKYACLKSGLSVGSILIIICISLLVVYLVAGILFNKYSKGASGKELIPNVNFWIDFPLLVKDGVVFSFECCKRVCSRKRSSYESI